MVDLFLFRSPVGHIFILISRRTHTYIDFLVCDTELIHILILISHRTHTYAYLLKDTYLFRFLKGHISDLYLYLSYGSYSGISDLILVFRNLFLYFRSYTCIPELILVFWILFLYFESYSCISDLILVQILFSNHFLSFSFRISVCDFTYGYRSRHSRQIQLLNPVLFVIQ